MIDHDFIFHWNNDNIISITKTIIDKSIETNNIIMNHKIENKSDIKKIICLIADDITMCQSLHSICSFLQYITNPGTNNMDTYTLTSSTTNSVTNTSTNSKKMIAKAELMLTNHENYLNSEVKIYNKLIKIKQYNNTKHKLSEEDLQFLNKLIECYKKNGIELSQKDKILLQKINKEIINVNSLIIKHVHSSENTFITIPYDNLTGMPLHIINTFENIDCDNIKIKLNKINYDLCMSHINNVSIRKEINDKYSKNKHEKIIGYIAKLIVFKDKHDKLLSFNNHSEYVLSNQMCKNTEEVQTFLKKLLKKVNIATKNNKNIWDTKYQINQWKIDNGFNNDIVKEYFEINDVIIKIIKLYELIFGINFIKINNAVAWSNDLIILGVMRNNNLEGYLYLDLFDRENKYKQTRCFCLQSACMYPILSGKYIKPIIALCASFNKYSNGKSLLNYDDVASIFHEFAHVLHHIFGKTKYILFSGLNVEDDFIETPGQLMELLCYEPFIIKYLSNHYCKKEKISDYLINKIIKLKTLENNLSYKKNILNSCFDQIIYSSSNFIKLCENALVENKIEQLYPAFEILYKKLYNELINDNTDVTLPDELIQIIYDLDSQYYNLLWSKMLAVDLYNENIKGKYIDNTIGSKIINCIFKFGGTKSAFEMCALYIGKELIISPLHDKISNDLPSLKNNESIYEQKSNEDNKTYDDSLHNKKYNRNHNTHHKNNKNSYAKSCSELKDENECIESVSNNFCEIIDE